MIYLLADNAGKASSDLNDLWEKLRATSGRNDFIVKE
jgi:hypothetical protein